MDVKKVLWISDGVKPTGFATVAHNVIKRLPKNWQVHHLAVNYTGDPHEYSHKIYPAMIGGDVWGFNRLESFAQNKFDAIFILNDLWVVDQYLDLIKKTWNKIPPIMVYFPVDAENFDEDWFRHFDIVTIPVVYTKFGKRVCKSTKDGLDYRIVPHGVDSNVFHKMDKAKARDVIFKQYSELKDGFFFLNVGRNQPRKRLDIALEAFKLFSDDKDGVYYYHHARS